MFPARAGMNRMIGQRVKVLVYVPRTGGDEPLGEMVPRCTSECSPHGRG